MAFCRLVAPSARATRGFGGQLGRRSGHRCRYMAALDWRCIFRRAGRRRVFRYRNRCALGALLAIGSRERCVASRKRSVSMGRIGKTSMEISYVPYGGGVRVPNGHRLTIRANYNRISEKNTLGLLFGVGRFLGLYASVRCDSWYRSLPCQMRYWERAYGATNVLADMVGRGYIRDRTPSVCGAYGRYT